MAVKTNNILKISTFSLAIICLMATIYFFKSEKSFEKFKEKAEVENQLKQNHLDEILHKYDSISLVSKSQNISNKAYISLAEQKINDKLFESLDVQSIDRQINLLKSAIKNDKTQVDFLTKKIVSDEGVLGKLESLKRPSVNTKVNSLSILNITARGVKILSDKLPKSKNKKIQELRICFTVEGNEFVKKGDKQFYIQIVNPKNQIISSEETFLELKDVKLIYSAKVDASYNQKDIDVCTYVGLEKDKTIMGKYKINIYNDFSKIGTAIFEYN
jgi:DNA-binding helix-hairpin-helix protein with protein kinase domain